MRLLTTIAFAMILFVFAQCKNERLSSGQQSPQPISGHLHGNVYNESGLPLSNATIRVGARTTQTDAEGFFYLSDASLDQKASLVTAEAQGYFKAYRVFAASNGTNQVSFKMIKRMSLGTVDAATGGTVQLLNGAAVSLYANGVVKDADKSPYSGPVHIYAAYIDPLAEDIGQTVPGSFVADDKNGARVHLISYGMLVVELASPSGEKLQVKEGATAKLKLPIPAVLFATAPATIPLWYVNDQTGIWKEEGFALKQGNYYEGNVNHFTPYNTDVPVPSIQLHFQLNSAGKALPFFHVRVKQDVSSVCTVTTNSEGKGSSSVPMNMPLVMEITDNCNNIVYTRNLPPSSQDINLGTIEVVFPSMNLVTVKGNIVNCNGIKVTNGYAVVNLNGQARTVQVDVKGSFSTDFLVCPNSQLVAHVRAVDLATQQVGNYLPVNLSSGAADVGSLSACGAQSQAFMNYVYDGNSYALNSQITDSLRINLTSNTGTIHCYNVLNGNNVQLLFDHAQQPGIYPIRDLAVQNFNTGQVSVLPNAWIKITKFATVSGDYFEGTYYARFTAGGDHQVGGSFKLKRK